MHNGVLTMELDELKDAWQSIDCQLARHNELNLVVIRDKQLTKTRSTLRPLYWGQIIQIVLGIISIVFGVKVWTNNSQSLPLLISGISIHLYGVVLIITASYVLRKIAALDYSAPVITIQKQLLKLEETYINTGWFTGLSWWVLWLPFTLGFAALAGIDLAALADDSGWVTGSLLFGLIAMVLTGIWYRWATHPRRGERAEKLKASLAGNSLKAARHQLLEVQRFEQE